MASWKAHLLPLSVAIPALVVVVLAAAVVLGLRWTPVNSLLIVLIIAIGILFVLFASRRIAGLVFEVPPKT